MDPTDDRGVTALGRPVLDAFPAEWTLESDAMQALAANLGISMMSLRMRVNALIRHGFIELRAHTTDAKGSWISREMRKTP